MRLKKILICARHSISSILHPSTKHFKKSSSPHAKMFVRFAGVRRKFRAFYQKVLLVTILITGSIFLFSYLNLEFCYKILAHNTLNNICNNYNTRKYSGSLCEELCNGEYFKEFKCPESGLKTAVFTAVKNHYVYAFKMANFVKEPLYWVDRNGIQHYPEIKDFQNMVKLYITITYNVTIDEDVIKALLSQEISVGSVEQIDSVWRLFKDNNYVMGKLFEEESMFPVILGSCGPFYATEFLKSVQHENTIRQYITTDWKGRLHLAMKILEYLHRLDEIKPEPLKLCKIEAGGFGITVDNRVKYRSARFAFSESQINKILSNGAFCKVNHDCRYENCIGMCDTKQNMCTGIQQNNNFQIVCHQILKGNRYFPGILSTTKAPKHLLALLESCADPSKNDRHHLPGKVLTPSNDITMKLYGEIKRIYNEITFHQ